MVCARKVCAANSSGPSDVLRIGPVAPCRKPLPGGTSFHLFPFETGSSLARRVRPGG